MLGFERDLIEGMHVGTVDAGVITGAPLAGFEPRMMVLDLPFIFKSRESAFKVMDGDIGKRLFGVPMALAYAALPVGGVLITFHFLVALGASAPSGAHRNDAAEWRSSSRSRSLFCSSPTCRSCLRSGPRRSSRWMIMLVPVLMPMAVQFNVDPLHFGIIIIATIGVGLFLPPIGLGLIVAAAIARVTIAEVARPLLPYLATMMATVLLIAFWPELTLVVPVALGLR